MTDIRAIKMLVGKKHRARTMPHTKKQHGAGRKKPQHGHGKTQHGMGKGKRTGGDPAFADRNVKQLRKEAAARRKASCRTYAMKRTELIDFIKKH